MTGTVAVVPDAPGDQELDRLRHDLRTPIAVVAGFAELLLTESPMPDAQRREYARHVAQAADQLRALLEPGRQLPS